MNKNMSNKEEKYYTDNFLIEKMLEMRDKYVDFDIEEYLENSAGSGNILKYLDKPYLAYDIKNETNHPHIKECNYLKEKIEYNKNRVAIINPPFSNGIKFLKKALSECGYVVSIMSFTSLFNINYDNIHVDEILMYKDYKFGDIKTNIIIIGCKLK